MSSATASPWPRGPRTAPSRPSKRWTAASSWAYSGTPSAWSIGRSRRRCSSRSSMRAPSARRTPPRRWRPPARPDVRGGRTAVSAPGTALAVEPYDEAFGPDGEPRPHYAALLDALAGVDLDGLRDAVNARVRRDGVTFTTSEGEQAFVIDPIPRILAADEWSALAAGLEQRVRALNAFVLDAYGERRAVAAGVLSDAAIDAAEGYQPELRGAYPDFCAPIGIAGLDVVRAADGALLVLEDNCRTPSSFTYMTAARRAVEPELPCGVAEPMEVADLLGDLVRGVLAAAAPEGVDEPSFVVVTDGPGGGAYYEHAAVAAALDVPLVTVADLTSRGDRLEARLEDGRRRPVDVVYRRSDEDRLRDERGAPTPIAEALLAPWRAGRLGLVNGFGTGLADDKLVHGRVADLIRLYLGEEPLGGAVPTLDLGEPEACAAVLADLRGYVVKPRFGQGGAGVVVCAHADAAALDAVRAELEADPGRFVAQPVVALSCHPTVIDGRLEPRHVDLRPFVFAAGVNIRSLPGGLTRVAWDAGALVVNSSQNGGAKDTWVLRPPA